MNAGVNPYLDASVLLPTIVDEPGSAAVDRFFRNQSSQLQVSDFAAAEVSSALSRLIRMGQLDREDVGERLSDFDAWRAMATVTPEMTGSDVRLASVYVRRFDLMLRTPDALHAAICRRLGMMLVTLDRRLATAAEALGISVQVPEA